MVSSNWREKKFAARYARHLLWVSRLDHNSFVVPRERELFQNLDRAKKIGAHYVAGTFTLVPNVNGTVLN